MKQVAATLYTLSAISVLAGAAVAPAMGRMSAHFQTDPMLISLIITLPSLMVIPCTFLAPKLCIRWGKKKVLMAGLVLYCLGGCGGAFTNSIGTLLACRAILGLGMGTLTPTAQSLPGDFYSGRDLLKVVGRMSAFLTMGAAVSSVGAGWLAILSWRASFAIYLVGLPALLMVLAFLPARTGQSTVRQNAGPEAASPPGKPQGLPPIIYAVAFTMMLYMAVFYALPLGLAIHIESSGLGNAVFAGNALALLSLVAFATGMFFPRLMESFRRFLLPLLLLCLGTGYLCLGAATSFWLLIPACLLAGIGNGGLSPLHYAAVNRLTPKPQLVKAMSLVVAGVFLGQFLSPFLTQAVALLSPLEGSGGVYASLGILIVSSAIVVALVRSRRPG